MAAKLCRLVTNIFRHKRKKKIASDFFVLPTDVQDSYNVKKNADQVDKFAKKCQPLLEFFAKLYICLDYLSLWEIQKC